MIVQHKYLHILFLTLIRVLHVHDPRTLAVQDKNNIFPYYSLNSKLFSRLLWLDFYEIPQYSQQIMDVIIHLNNHTAGRDKLIRFMQYGSRAYWYYAQKKNGTIHSVNLLKSLEYTFSSFRKLLRLGRFLDSLYSALQTMKYPDVVVRVTLTMSKIAYSLYLLADHIIWCGRAGIFKVNLEKWNNVANKYWLMTIVMNLARDIHEILHILETRSRNFISSAAKMSKYERIQKQIDTYRQHEDVILDTLKNSCDLFIPLTALGFTKLSPGSVGLLGVVSSAVGIYSLIRPEAKLVPC